MSRHRDRRRGSPEVGRIEISTPVVDASSAPGWMDTSKVVVSTSHRVYTDSCPKIGWKLHICMACRGKGCAVCRDNGFTKIDYL